MDAKAAARIESLRHSPAWDDLKELLEAQEEKYWKRHIADLKNGVEIDQRSLDRALGKLDGIRALISAPEKAATIMERHTNRQEPS